MEEEEKKKVRTCAFILLDASHTCKASGTMNDSAGPVLTYSIVRGYMYRLTSSCLGVDCGNVEGSQLSRSRGHLDLWFVSCMYIQNIHKRMRRTGVDKGSTTRSACG